MKRSKAKNSNKIMSAWRKEIADHRQKALKKKAKELGCSNNLKLAEYVMDLEDKIIHLEDHIDSLENKYY